MTAESDTDAGATPLDEKLARPRTPDDTIARMTLRHLRTRWGGIVPDGVPDVIDINGMTSELWLRVEGRGRGDDSVYQLEREYQGP